MKNKKQTGLFFLLFIVITTLFVGTLLEHRFVSLSLENSEDASFSSLTFFFGVVNLNVILLFGLVFFVFRQIVKLAIDRKNSVFGSSLRTKLVTSFLFFSLLPSVSLLYVSTKFVKANFEKWLPRALVETTELSAKSESEYLNNTLMLLNTLTPQEVLTKFPDKTFSFNFETNEVSKSEFVSKIFDENEVTNTRLATILYEKIDNFHSFFQWIHIDTGITAAIAKDKKTKKIFGFIGPRLIHPSWQNFDLKSDLTQENAQMVQISYYIMLAVITFLVTFSALWLGFTIAREFANPLLILAAATQSVAQGNYEVEIDDIVSDDEIGLLARDFKSMTEDLKTTHTSLKRAMDELKNKAIELEIKNDFLSFLIEHISTSVIVVDKNQVIIGWNQKSTAIFGQSEFGVINKTLSEVFEPTFYQKVFKETFDSAIQNSSQSTNTVGYSGTLSGRELKLEITTSLYAFDTNKSSRVILINDITDLVKAHRLAAWKEVAKRMAHEIKNPLTPIRLGAQRIEKKFLEKVSPQEKISLKECLDVIIHSGDSIRALVDEFIEFSRLPQSVFKKGDLLEVLSLAAAGFKESNETENFSILYFKRRDAMPVNVDKSSVKIECLFDFGQINRLFVNLFTNATAAISTENIGPERTGKVECQAEIYENEKVVRVKIIDNGCGISPEIKSRLFEPYFTTKRSGMGIGLVIVQQISLEHSWKLWFENNSPHGTVCVIEVCSVVITVPKDHS